MTGSTRPPGGQAPASRRAAERWHHRVGRSFKHSLKWRLVALFLVLAAGMSAAFLHGMQKAFAQGWREAVRPLLADYVDRLAAEVGTPPSLARAQALVARLPISVRVEGPVVQFDTHPKIHGDPKSGRWERERWQRGEYGGDPDNARLLERRTADGHTIHFGLGDLNWRRGPAMVGWITLTALLALTAAAWWLVRRMFKPIDDIGAGAKRFGAGDFASPIPIRRHDELGELAAQINTMGQDIQRMLDAKRGLLLAISHELRSPLTRARLHTELLPESPDASTQRSALLRDLSEMSQLISDLLESERLSERHAALNLTPVDLASLVREVVMALGAESSTTLRVPTGLPSVRLDATRMRLLVRNLMDNALRHNPPGAAACELTLTLLEPMAGGQPMLQLTVRDHGAGVDEASLPMLGEAFYRPDASRQRGTGGVGLGLHLSKLVAQAHGGTLRFANAHPGLQATVRLPVVPIVGVSVS